MSTGASCSFYEKSAGKWFYDIQQYPYGETEDFDTHGPFGTFRQAHKHLHDYYPNPGGFWCDALPGCKHDLLNGDGNCDRCGAFADAIKKSEPSK